MRTAKSASRERPVTTSSRKTPAPRSPAPALTPIRTAATAPTCVSSPSEPSRFSTPPAGAVLSRVRRVQDREHGERDEHRSDDQGEGRENERRAACATSGARRRRVAETAAATRTAEVIKVVLMPLPPVGT